MNDRVQEALADSAAWFPNLVGDIPHYLISMMGEAGEINNAYKKWDRLRLASPEQRKQFAVETDTHWAATREHMAGELVDTLVYLFCLAGELNIDLDAEYDKKRGINDARFNAAKFRDAGGSEASTDGTAGTEAD